MKICSQLLLLVLSVSLMGDLAPAASHLEVDLGTLMLDQRDPLLYSQQVIPAGEQSSLCGPVSAVNWLQWDGASLRREEQVQLIDYLGRKLKEQNLLDINKGLIESDLVKYLQAQDRLFKKRRKYGMLSFRSYHSEDLTANLDSLLDDPQRSILLLRFREIPRSVDVAAGDGRRVPRPPAPRLEIPLDQNLAQIFHYVLKVHSDRESGEVWLVDPENPHTYTIVKASVRVNGNSQTVGLQGKTGLEFPRFKWGVPTRVDLMSAIVEIP